MRRPKLFQRNESSSPSKVTIREAKSKVISSQENCDRKSLSGDFPHVKYLHVSFRLGIRIYKTQLCLTKVMGVTTAQHPPFSLPSTARLLSPAPMASCTLFLADKNTNSSSSYLQVSFARYSLSQQIKIQSSLQHVALICS